MIWPPSETQTHSGPDPGFCFRSFSGAGVCKAGGRGNCRGLPKSRCGRSLPRNRRMAGRPNPVFWEAVAPYKQSEAMDQSRSVLERRCPHRLPRSHQGDRCRPPRGGVAAQDHVRYRARSARKHGDAVLLGPECRPRREGRKRTTRQIMSLRHAGEPGPLVELEKGFSEEAARKEAARCLQCGLICYERPDMNPELKAAVA